MNTDTQYLSKEKFEELTYELEELKTKKRKEIAENLEYSKALGDLSENAEYHEAREAQMNLEERISKIESLLKSAVIMSGKRGDVVGIGATVSLKKKGASDHITYTLVGSEEADLAVQRISITSPIADAMVGKKKGESFYVITPKGKTEYVIIEIV
jgi:transcription elongation factor GreA